MKTPSLLPYMAAGAAGALIFSSLPSFISTSHAETKLLPFQGRLTDSVGSAIPDGAKVVEFKMYDSPTGGNAKWTGEVQKLSVNGGLVSTLLGSKASLGALDFSTPTFLQITIDANDDGQITAADPPLLPRQSVVPAVYAAVAGQIQYVVPAAGGNPASVASKGWEAVFDDGNPQTGRIPGGKLADASVPGAKISPGSLPASAITANNQLTAAHLANNSVNTAEIANGAILPEKLAPLTLQQLVPPGTIIPYAGAVIDNESLVEPVPGYLLCNGAVIDGTAEAGKYSGLRTVLGNAWGNGGNASSAQLVNLPDLRGVFLRGWSGSMQDTSAWVDPEKGTRVFRHPGGAIGNMVGSFQLDEFRSHNHNVANASATGFSSGALARSNISVAGTYNTFRIQSAGGSEEPAARTPT